MRCEFLRAKAARRVCAAMTHSEQAHLRYEAELSGECSVEDERLCSCDLEGCIGSRSIFHGRSWLTESCTIHLLECIRQAASRERSKDGEIRQGVVGRRARR